MITAAHYTPGPWFITRDSRWNSVCRIGRAWDIVTKLPLSEFGHPDMDARLIAAAPDLLRELEHAIRFFDQLNPEDVARYRAVVAKATGTEGEVDA